jgi:hypothetical protein
MAIIVIFNLTVIVTKLVLDSNYLARACSMIVPDLSS